MTLIAPPAHSQPLPEGVSRTPGGAYRKTLANGMDLLVIPNHAAPVAVVNTWFRVGARNESPADAGISHFLEHMLFDGSEGMPLDEFNRFLFAHAIDNNASTDFDNTNYFHVGPAEKLPEIARMTALLVSQPLLLDSEFGREREVVKEELRQGLDNPIYFLWDLAIPPAMAHAGYRHAVIGDAPTLDAQSNDQMRAYYRNYYGPNNAFTIAVGDVDPLETLALLEAEYGSWEPVQIAPDPVLTEWTQNAPQSLIGHRDFATNYFALVWPTAPASGQETYALQVLAAILGDGDSSRLVKRLKLELGLLSDVGLETQELITQSLIFGYGELVDPARTQEAVEEVFRVITELRGAGPAAEEIERAKCKLILAHQFAGEDVQQQAYQIGYALNATGSLDYYETYAERIAGVTVEDVHWAAQQYLVPEKLTLALASPDREQSALQPDWGFLYPAMRMIPRPGTLGRAGTVEVPVYPASTPADRERALHRMMLSNGMEIIIRPVSGTGTAGFTLASRHGLDLETWETNGLAALLERTLLRGSTVRSADAIAEEIDALGGHFGIEVDYDTAQLSGLLAAKDLNRGLGLLAEVIREAAFPEEEVATAREILLAEIASRADEPYNMTHDQLALAMWGEESAYGRPPLGRPGVVEGLTRTQVQDFARRLFYPGALVLAIVGDVEPEAALSQAGLAFSDWQVAQPALPARAVAEFRRPEGFQRIINQQSKAQTMSVLGLPGVSVDHPDLPALQVVDMVLGGSWLSRLFDRLRGREGLAYGTYSKLEAHRDGGAITARIGTRPEMWEQAITGLKREFRLVATEGLTAEEIAVAVTYTRGQTLMRHAGMQAQSQYLASNVALGLAPDHEWQVLEAMSRVTVAEANAVAAKYYNPEAAWLAVTGDLFRPAPEL